MIWQAYCKECGLLCGYANGAFVEAEAKIHAKETSHIVLVGYEVTYGNL